MARKQLYELSKRSVSTITVTLFPSLRGYFQIILNENSTVIEGDCEVSLRSSSQQPPLPLVIYVKCDRVQPRIEPVT